MAFPGAGFRKSAARWSRWFRNSTPGAWFRSTPPAFTRHPDQRIEIALRFSRPRSTAVQKSIARPEFWRRLNSQLPFAKSSQFLLIAVDWQIAGSEFCNCHGQNRARIALGVRQNRLVALREGPRASRRRTDFDRRNSESAARGRPQGHRTERLHRIPRN